MSDTLFELNQYQSQAHISYSPDWRDATGTDPAWEQPDLELDLGANSQEPDGDVATGWRTEAEFTLTLQSGQTIEVKFVPGLVGKRRMHEFSFTGPISPTGFKSHFVLAIKAEEFPDPRAYAQAYAEEMLARFEAQQQRSGFKRSPEDLPLKRSLSVVFSQTPQGQTNDQDNSTEEPIMAEDNTPESNHVPIEIVEQLSPEEEADRQQLELRVDRALYSAGCALRELRDRRLYRSTHFSWQEYCRERFGYGRDSADLKILAAEVVENLEDKVPTNRRQILPTKLEQIRPLTKLKPEEQRQVWQEAVDAAGGKVPSGRLVKDVALRHMGIVESLKQKNTSPPEFAPGDVVEIKALKRSPLHPFNGMWAVIEHVGSFSYTVRISIARDTQQCKPEELTLIDDEYTADIKAVGQRIAALVQFELEPVEYAILELLQLETCFTPRQLLYLERMEADYGKSN